MARTSAAKADPITGAALAPATKRAKLAAVPVDLNTPTADRKAANAEAAKKAVGKEFKPPKNMALCADAYYAKREERLAMEKVVAKLAAEENACREALITGLPKGEASGIAGKLCRVAVENKEVYTVKDWSVETGVWGYILKNAKKNPGLTGMLQRRINDGMVKEMAAAGKAIPGTEKMDVPVLRVNKL